MKRAENISEIRAALDKIEDAGTEYVTNFLIGDAELERWIKQEQVTFEVTPTNVFIFRQRHGCQRLYFASANRTTLSAELYNCLLENPDTIMVSVLDRGDEANFFVKEILNAAGFLPYKTLKRMTLIRQSDIPKINDIEFASVEDFTQIEEILSRYFDPLLDNRPDKEEILDAIKNKRILVARVPKTGAVAAFCSFEKKHKTLWLRYIASREEYRKDFPYGRFVLSSLLSLHPDVVRGICWVWENNHRAIKLYVSLGYRFDGATDSVFLFRRSMDNILANNEVIQIESNGFTNQKRGGVRKFSEEYIGNSRSARQNRGRWYRIRDKFSDWRRGA